jgi:hypothetical protein
VKYATWLNRGRIQLFIGNFLPGVGVLANGTLLASDCTPLVIMLAALTFRKGAK